MAIQDFVTGQVLTSTQMDNLQANDYNQTVSAKVASYVLVAADKGTRVTMSNAGATTITVNTALFAAGDTLFITNIGAGACTITAGTATVSTASSLVLAQYDSGRLYFTSTGVAIWEKYAGASAASGSLTLLSTTALSGASTTISIAAGYKNLQIEAVGVTNSTADGRFKITPNASTTITDGAGLQLINTISISFWDMQNFIGSTQTIQARANADNATLLNIYNYASTSDYKNFNYTSGFLDTGGAQRANSMASGTIRTASAISSMKFENTGGSFAGGTVRIYGVN